jgi:hypothetical protein
MRQINAAISDMMSALNSKVEGIKREQDRQRTREIAQVATSRPVYATVAELPTASAERVGWQAHVLNGRKSGEGVGAGTGVNVTCMREAGTGTYLWCRETDYTGVVA